MRLEWLEDILAVLETGSLIKAAEQRLLTQPAFSRRIKTIENYIGVDILDRTKKPAQLKKTVVEQQRNIQDLAAGLRELRHELKRQDRETQNHIVIASQHAIATSIVPTLVKKLLVHKEISVRLRSVNRDECYALLMTKQADFIMIYQSADEQLPSQEGFLEKLSLGQDLLIPVYATTELKHLNENYSQGSIPVIVYPPEAFLGQVMNREIFPRLWNIMAIHKKAETALTLAALQLAISGVGIAWIPHSLALPEIENGRLTDLRKTFPSSELSIVAIRLNDTKSPAKDLAWQALI